MRQFPAPIHNAVVAFSKLPGVGPKTALRYIFTLLRFSDQERINFARAIEGLNQVRKCTVCFAHSEKDICELCANSSRQNNILCIVSESRDIATIESTGTFKGRYFVLGGTLNPIEGHTPETLNIKKLHSFLDECKQISEIILAFSPDVHGETTMMYLSRLLKPRDKKISKLARGLPLGAALEYADEVTLGAALTGRREVL